MRSKLIIVLLIVGMIGLFYGGGYIYQQYKSNAAGILPTTTAAKTVAGGEKVIAPDFSLQDSAGKTVRLSDYRGKVVVINFWASWCPPCKEEMPDINAINQEFIKDGGIVLLSINLTDGQRETKSKADAYIKDNKFSLHVLYDDAFQAATAYSVNSIPTTVVVNAAGEVVSYQAGMLTKAALWSLVNAAR